MNSSFLQFPFAEAVRVLIDVSVGSESSRGCRGVWCPLGGPVVSTCLLFVLGLPVGSQSPFPLRGPALIRVACACALPRLNGCWVLVRLAVAKISHSRGETIDAWVCCFGTARTYCLPRGPLPLGAASTPAAGEQYRRALPRRCVRARPLWPWSLWLQSGSLGSRRWTPACGVVFFL